MTAVHWIPPASIVDPDVGELAEIAPRLVEVLHQRAHAPVEAIVGRIQSELGIRAQPAEAYGPTSHVSEAALFFAYRNTAERLEDPDAA